jgi:acid phosphatase (class A)
MNMRYLHQALLASMVAFTACAAGPTAGTGPSAGAVDTLMPGATASSAAAATGNNAAVANGAAPAAAGGPPGPRGPRDNTPPYLQGDQGNFYTVMPPAPKNGDARDEADRRIFRETRALAGTPRWQMAIEDAELGTAAMLKHFSCSLGIEATAEKLPRLVALLQKATREAARTVGPAKEFYARKRPFLVDEGPTCVPESTIGKSFDYPSGHTTAGWAWALVLAQVDPGNAEKIIKRGRAIGDSRVVCGMHNASAVEAARLLTSSAMAAVAASPLYQADVVVARAELQTLRAGEHTRPDPQRCALEEQLVGQYW